MSKLPAPLDRLPFPVVGAPHNLPESDHCEMNFGGNKSEACKDIWSCG